MTVTLITGANSGLGRATALLLAQKGHKVYAGMRNLEKGSKLLELAKDCDLSAIQIDVTDDDSVLACANEINENGDSVDVLVNNAGGLGGVEVGAGFLSLPDFGDDLGDLVGVGGFVEIGLFLNLT